MDSLSTDITLLATGGENKLACCVKELSLTNPDGTRYTYGRLLWAFGQAFLNLPIGSTWLTILTEMSKVSDLQGIEIPLLFHGQLTRLFSEPSDI